MANNNSFISSLCERGKRFQNHHLILWQCHLKIIATTTTYHVWWKWAFVYVALKDYRGHLPRESPQGLWMSVRLEKFFWSLPAGNSPLTYVLQTPLAWLLWSWTIRRRGSHCCCCWLPYFYRWSWCDCGGQPKENLGVSLQSSPDCRHFRKWCHSLGR